MCGLLGKVGNVTIVDYGKYLVVSTLKRSTLRKYSFALEEGLIVTSPDLTKMFFRKALIGRKENSKWKRLVLIVSSDYARKHLLPWETRICPL